MYSLKLGNEWLQVNATTFGPAKFSENDDFDNTMETESAEALERFQSMFAGSVIGPSPRPH